MTLSIRGTDTHQEMAGKYTGHLHLEVGVVPLLRERGVMSPAGTR